MKDDALFLLNDEIQSNNDEQIEKNKADGEYEKTVLECNTWSSFIKSLVGRNITVPSKSELDNVQFEYGEIVNYSEISNGDEIDDVWNKSDYGTGPQKTQKI